MSTAEVDRSQKEKSLQKLVQILKGRQVVLDCGRIGNEKLGLSRIFECDDMNQNFLPGSILVDLGVNLGVEEPGVGLLKTEACDCGLSEISKILFDVSHAG